MERTSFLISFSIGAVLASSALAGWFNDFDDQVALSDDASIVFTCPPTGVDFIGPTFEAYFNQPLPVLQEPELVFEFDSGEQFVWSANYGAEVYVGPMENPYGEEGAATLSVARLQFGTHRAAIGNWVALAERFMAQSTVTVIANGVSHGPISLAGSSKALRHIAYSLPPC